MSNDDNQLALVQEFYQAVRDKDATRLAAVVAGGFGDDTRMVWPESLPYGGEIVGARSIQKALTAMVTAARPIGPCEVVVTDLIRGEDKVVAQVEFDYYPPKTTASVRGSALEIWTFSDGRVRQVRAYYWDTAAYVQRE